jgi:3-methyladenine DNA glycosylase AlkD
MNTNIAQTLFQSQDTPYAKFQSRLLPTVDSETIIGVRTPILRGLAKKMLKDGSFSEFIGELPHSYFEENQLHGFIISEMKDFNQCVAELEKFLPYIDNWATCDQTSPKIFKKNHDKLLPLIYKWLDSDHTYTVRFAIGMLMKHFLDEDFKPKYLDTVTAIRSEEYYINMEIGWYMATALDKQWDAAFPYISGHKMSPWVHNCTIKKAKESLRISDERKKLLATYICKGNQ